MLGLRHTWNTKHYNNDQEDYYLEGWDIVSEKVESLLNKSWEYQLKGNQKVADKINKSANIHFYLFYYSSAMRNHLDRSSNDNRCALDIIRDRFNFSCIEDRLQCLGIDNDTNYLDTWNRLLDAFGISMQAEGCHEENGEGYCLGIGEMIIDDFDDSIAFIVGPCETAEDDAIRGEFSPCEFLPIEFTKTTGAVEDIYSDCDKEDSKNRCD